MSSLKRFVSFDLGDALVTSRSCTKQYYHMQEIYWLSLSIFYQQNFGYIVQSLLKSAEISRAWFCLNSLFSNSTHLPKFHRTRRYWNDIRVPNFQFFSNLLIIERKYISTILPYFNIKFTMTLIVSITLHLSKNQVAL